MISNPAGNASYSQTSRDPNLAAGLSIVPGLGQLYNGQIRKGALFLAVSTINVFNDEVNSNLITEFFL